MSLWLVPQNPRSKFEWTGMPCPSPTCIRIMAAHNIHIISPETPRKLVLAFWISPFNRDIVYDPDLLQNPYLATFSLNAIPKPTPSSRGLQEGQGPWLMVPTWGPSVVQTSSISQKLGKYNYSINQEGKYELDPCDRATCKVRGYFEDGILMDIEIAPMPPFPSDGRDLPNIYLRRCYYYISIRREMIRYILDISRSTKAYSMFRSSE